MSVATLNLGWQYPGVILHEFGHMIGLGRGATPQETAVDLPVSQMTIAEISEVVEKDLYRFAVTSAGTFVVQAAGSTDVVMSLFGPYSTSNLIGEDDDGVTGANARISAVLQPGDYYTRVRHYKLASRGEY